MSEMNSFYGGRQGASFVIVKRFDGLDIPKNSAYRVGWFAKDTDGYFYVPLIERNANNYADYPDWGSIPKDGTTKVTSQSGITSEPLAIEYAEGMKQCFEQGGATFSQVGYGEYVIIDTIFGLGEYINPDNGRVYRRGMNYDSDLGGAEYIGQVVGPKGDSPKIDMSTVEDVSSHTESRVREYDMTEGAAQNGIVPGKYVSDNVIKYNDAITYSWATIRDDHHNITGALIGFTFPYLVPEISSFKRSAYYTQEDYNLGRISDTNLIGTAIKESDNFLLFVDNDESSEDRDPTHGDTGHAFYRRWKLSIPQGIKGDTQTQLEIVPQKIRAGAPLWGSQDVSGDPVAAADNETYVILDDDKFNKDCVYPYDDSSAIVVVRKQSVPEVQYYAKIEDTYMLKFRYRQTWYDVHEDGSDYNIIDLGDYNTIRKVWLTENGYLWVSYNADEDSTINPNNPIQWYENVNVLNDGTIVFTYNTLDGQGNNNEQIFSEAIDWVDSVALANVNNPDTYDHKGNQVNSGHFRVIFNNDSVDTATGYWTDTYGTTHSIWETDLTWPQSVSLNSEGLLKFLYNNNLYPNQSIYTDIEEGSYQFSIPWITNALIAQDGTFTLSYNNEVNATVYPPEEWNSETHTWTRVLNFVDHVVIDEDGTIHFYYSNGNEAPNDGYDNIKIKYLTDVQVNTGMVEDSDIAFEGEGTGDQRINLTWNTEVSPGTKDTSIIGAPLNYIMEALVTSYDENAPSTPQNHLLILYSDPVYRQFLRTKYPNKIYRYTSQKFTEVSSSQPYKQITPVDNENPSEEDWYELINGSYILTTDTIVDSSKNYYIKNLIPVIRDDWFDLGYVKGEPGGLHIIGQYELQEGQSYTDYLTDGVPPEDMPGNTPEDRGWAYLIYDNTLGLGKRTIYTYDYIHEEWVIVSEINSAASVDPTQSIIMDESTIDDITHEIKPKNEAYRYLPQTGGLWFVQSNILAAY